MDDVKDKMTHSTAENSNDKKWYVVMVTAGLEKKVAQTLESRVRQFGMEDSFGATLIPTESVIEVRRGEKITIEKPIMPGYLLVEIRVNDHNAFALVRKTPRVRKFVTADQNGDPEPLSPDDIRPIVDYSEGTAKAPGPSVAFEVGESVRISGGPFDGWSGNIQEIDPNNNRLKVLVPIFGRLTPIDLNYDQVKRDVE